MIGRMLMAKIILLCCARQAKGRSISLSFARAWLLANADHVLTQAAASMCTAYFSIELRHPNC